MICNAATSGSPPRQSRWGRRAIDVECLLTPTDALGIVEAELTARFSNGKRIQEYRIPMSDRDLFYHMGLFFIENWPMDSGNHRHHSPNSVSDGLSQTLMLSENVRAGYDAGHDTTWAAPGPLWSSFVLSGYICDNAICSTGHVHYANANSRSGGPWSHEAINSGLSAAEGTAPWPNSFHPAGCTTLSPTVTSSFCPIFRSRFRPMAETARPTCAVSATAGDIYDSCSSAVRCSYLSCRGS